MTNPIFIVPANGLKVRDPETLADIPDEGRIVDGNNPHWIRRIKEGTVIIGVDPTSHVRKKGRQ